MIAIIFNLPAILVVILIGVLLVPVHYLAPNLLEGPWGDVVIGATALVVGALTDVVGLKGRLFFIPIWVLGLGGMGYGLYKHWGWLGPGAAVAVVVTAFAALMVLSYRSEKQEWTEAPAAIEAAEAAAQLGDTATAWVQLERAFFTPGMLDCTPHMGTHGRRTLQLLNTLMDGYLSEQQRQLLMRLDADFVQAEAGGDDAPGFDSDVVDPIKELIESKGKAPEAEEEEAAA